MISIDKIDDGLPVSVIVPFSRKREKFFNEFVLPMIEANNVNEIIINSSEGSAPKKRNDGFKKSTQPYLFFIDDDIVLPANHIEKLYNELIKQEKIERNNVGYTYSGYQGIVLNPATHPMRGNFSIKTIAFNPSRLKQSNYISTMSLINRKHFPMFDENLKRFQDWDIWLNMLINKNINGKEVYNNEFFAYYLDEGITSKNNNEQEAMKTIIKKYKL